MISTPILAPNSRIVSGFPRLTCGFTGSLPFAVEHWRELRLPILLPQRWGTDIASYPGREATTPPLASLSGISTRRRLQPHSLSVPFILVCVGVGVVHVIVVWPQECTREVQRHRRIHIWGDTPIKGPPAFNPCTFIRHQQTCSRSPDAFAPRRVLTRLKVAEQPSWHVRPAGPSLGKSLSIGLPWQPSWRRQPYCWQIPCGYYRWWAAGRVCSVLGLMRSPRQDPARPQNALSVVRCVVFSVAVMCCVMLLSVCPLLLSHSGLGPAMAELVTRTLHSLLLFLVHRPGKL